MIISSQRYIDEAIVAEKQAACDYVVTLAPVSEGDESYDVVVDGHHSLEAARRDGVEPEWKYDYSYQAEVESMGLHNWLIAKYMDSDYYNVADGRCVW